MIFKIIFTNYRVQEGHTYSLKLLCIMNTKLFNMISTSHNFKNQQKNSMHCKHSKGYDSKFQLRLETAQNMQCLVHSSFHISQDRVRMPKESKVFFFRYLCELPLLFLLSPGEGKSKEKSKRHNLKKRSQLCSSWSIFQ